MTRVLRNIGQLATCPGSTPQADAGLIENAALVVDGPLISWCGSEASLPPEYREVTSHDCCGQLVVPGLIDCHTHLCFGGWRGDEFAQRLQGATYLEIAASGGGIQSTVAKTRSASRKELLEKTRSAMNGMLALGVTSVECKSGYGLSTEHELRILDIYRELDGEHALDLVPTFMGAHTVPPEYQHRKDDYVDLVCDEMLPAVANEKLAEFCDIFVEQGAFTVPQARRILSRAADLGLRAKIHADQLSDGGGAMLAAEVSAVSAEHLEYADAKGMAAMASAGTVAVSLPLASLYLGEPYMAARSFMDAGVAVAVASDFNPGSAPSFHLPLAMTLACLNQGMTPVEVLNGVTCIAARAAGIADDRGSLVPGFVADLAIIDAPNLNHWLYHFSSNACSAVMKRGRWIEL